MAKTNDAYHKIAKMWTFPESQSFRKMLEALLTPEDAALLLEMTVPVTAAQLAKRLDIDERSLSAKLDIFAKRGLVFRGRTEYHFKRGLHFGFAGMPASEEYAPSMVLWFI